MADLLIRTAQENELSGLIKLLADDELGRAREAPENIALYKEAFIAILNDKNQILLVGVIEDEIVATTHLTIIPSLTFKASTRLNIEAVRVASKYRGQGIGNKIINYAIKIAKEKKIKLIQLAMNKERNETIEFYKKLGFRPTHIGLKIYL